MAILSKECRLKTTALVVLILCPFLSNTAYLGWPGNPYLLSKSSLASLPSSEVLKKAPSANFQNKTANLQPRDSSAYYLGDKMPPSTYVNAVYYPNYEAYSRQPPSCLDLNTVTHVYYAFVGLNSDGSLAPTDHRADCQLPVDGTAGCLNAWGQVKAKNEKLKVLLSMGGAGARAAAFEDVAAHDNKLATFVQSARNMVEKYGFDGIDIDWEHPETPQSGRLYVKLLAGLRSALPSPYILTTALPSGRWVLDNIPMEEAANSLDYINLMTYDFAGPKFAHTKVTAHHALLCASGDSQESGSSGVANLIKSGFPAHKILLGVPTYGQSFLGASGLHQPFSGAGGHDGTFAVRDLPRPGTQEIYDESASAAYCTGGDGGFVTYDNAQSVERKALYARDQGLAGLFYWHIGFDRCNEESLVGAGFKALHGDKSAVRGC